MKILKYLVYFMPNLMSLTSIIAEIYELLYLSNKIHAYYFIIVVVFNLI